MYAKIGLSIRPYQRKMFPGDYHNCNDHNINETKYYNFSLNLSNFTPGVALQFLVSYTACFFYKLKTICSFDQLQIILQRPKISQNIHLFIRFH